MSTDFSVPQKLSLLVHLCQESPSTGEQWCTNTRQRRLWWPLCEFRAWWWHMGGLAKWVMWNADPNRSRQRLPWIVKWNMKLNQVTVGPFKNIPWNHCGREVVRGHQVTLPGSQPPRLTVMTFPFGVAGVGETMRRTAGFRWGVQITESSWRGYMIYMTINDVEGYWRTVLDIFEEHVNHTFKQTMGRMPPLQEL